MRLILQAYRWQKQVGNQLLVVPGEGHVRQVLKVSGLAPLFRLDGDESGVT